MAGLYKPCGARTRACRVETLLDARVSARVAKPRVVTFSSSRRWDRRSVFVVCRCVALGRVMTRPKDRLELLGIPAQTPAARTPGLPAGNRAPPPHPHRPPPPPPHHP